MGKKLIIAVLAVAVGLPSASLMASSPGAAEDGRYRTARKYERKYVAKKRKWYDDSYAARAHNLDPAGDYKGYPDWARVALSPKFDGNSRSR